MRWRHVKKQLARGPFHARKRHLARFKDFQESKGPMILCVWNEHQRVPATVYGTAHHPNNYEIRVCRDPAQTCVELHAQGKRALVYAFGGASSCGGGR